MDLRSGSKRKNIEAVEDSDLRPTKRPRNSMPSMARLDVSKTMERFYRKEFRKGKKAERAVSTPVNPTTNENDVVSDDSTVDGDSESEDEKISGSAQSHLVFNLAEFASALDVGDDGVSNTRDTAPGSSTGQSSTVQQMVSHRKGLKKEKYGTAESLGLKSLERCSFMVKMAKTKKVIFTSFSFADAVSEKDNTRAKNKKKTEQDDTNWDDHNARVGFSSDGVAIVYSLPSLLLAPEKKRLFQVLMQMGRKVQLKIGGADLNGRNTAESYVEREGELVGCIKLVKFWHAIGHTNDEPTISSDFIQSGSQFTRTTTAVAEMKSLSLLVNVILEKIDKDQFEALTRLFTKICQRYPFAKALSSIDPLIMEGRAVMFNRRTPLHTDSLDPLHSWATMITFGTFTEGGECYIPRLKLRIRYLPGDAIIIRGRILPHEVEEWGPGQRISIAHFTHTSLWNMEGMTCP